MPASRDRPPRSPGPERLLNACAKLETLTKRRILAEISRFANVFTEAFPWMAIAMLRNGHAHWPWHVSLQTEIRLGVE